MPTPYENMHNEVLNDAQIGLLPLMKQFKREYYLVGGTAIALYLGHRRSIDFDMFKKAAIDHQKNLSKFEKAEKEILVTRHNAFQMNLIADGVKVTFFQYAYNIEAKQNFQQTFRIPTLLDLAAMKAFAIGRRSKWKDYVDLYFLITEHFTISQISRRAEELFGGLFLEKLFRAQLAYFEDVDYTEEVDYLVPNPPTNEQIQDKLVELATSGL